jgi:UDP-2-acetamido-3-amino-2,3-dideoxy-glucuronate N-acetyltransferase
MNDSGRRHHRRGSGPEFLPIGPAWDTAPMDSTTPNSGPAFVHPSADVEDGAQVGAGTKVWHLAHIRSSATVGDDCVIGRNVYVDANAVVGSRVKIQNNVSVYQGVTIEDDVFVGPCAVFTNDLRPRAHNTDWKITPTLVRRGASIGANATLVCGIEVGEHAMIAAGSVVTKNVEPYQLVAGNPARPRGWVDESGEILSRDPASRPSNLA